MANIYKCGNCNTMVIAEEVGTHECKTVQGYRIEGNILWLSDGELWYPRKLLTVSPTDSEHPDKDDNINGKANKTNETYAI